jgi:hypothetical protein
MYESLINHGANNKFTSNFNSEICSTAMLVLLTVGIVALEMSECVLRYDIEMSECVLCYDIEMSECVLCYDIHTTSSNTIRCSNLIF